MTAGDGDAGGCWVCGAAPPEVRPWRDGIAPGALRAEDFRITDARYGTTLPLARCGRCGFVFAPAARALDLAALYAALDDEEYVRTGASRRLQMRALVRRATRLHPTARTLLDVGAGAGLLVDEASRAGLAAVGVEPSRRLSAHARASGIGVVTGSLPHAALGAARFDVVMLVDVLEHVADPVALLQRCAERLAPGGILVVVTPDVASAAARALGRRWWHFRIAHVGYFTRETLARVAGRAGLAVAVNGRSAWYLPLGYLVARLGAYLPGPRRSAVGRARRPPRWLDRLTVPLDLRDSLFAALRATPSASQRDEPHAP